MVRSRKMSANLVGAIFSMCIIHADIYLRLFILLGLIYTESLTI